MRWIELVLTVVGAVLASSGFWAWMQNRNNKKSASNQMLLGLGHDRIIYLCEKYIARGWISSDEYENLDTYLYQPYTKMGGNGTAKRLMAIVDNLPTKEVEYTSDGKRIESETRNPKRPQK